MTEFATETPNLSLLQYEAVARPAFAGLQEWRIKVRRGEEISLTSVVRSLDGVLVGTVQVGRCSARRAPGPEGQLWVIHVVGGAATAVRGRQRMPLAAGDLAIWPGDAPVSLHVADGLKLLVMALPSERWRHLAEPDGGAPRRVLRHDSPMGPVLAGFFDGLGQRLTHLAERHGAMVVDIAQAMLTHWVDGERRKAAMAVSNPLLARVLAHADAHLADPDLGPQALASAHGMSLRSLHLLFEREGLRVAQWIRDRRLERCRETLAQPDWQGRIIDVAMRWGFNDPSHFSRVYRQRYGHAPRQARGASLARRTETRPEARWAA